MEWLQREELFLLLVGLLLFVCFVVDLLEPRRRQCGGYGFDETEVDQLLRLHAKHEREDRGKGN